MDTQNPEAPFGGWIPWVRAGLFYATAGIGGNVGSYALLIGDFVLFICGMSIAIAVVAVGDRLLWQLDDAPVPIPDMDADLDPVRHWWLVLVPLPSTIAAVHSPDFILWDVIELVKAGL